MPGRIWTHLTVGVFLLLSMGGCGSAASTGALSLHVEQEEWDRVSVTWNLLDAPSGLELRDPIVVLYDANYDTLYAGTDAHVDVPDHELGNSERLLMEVCGGIEGEQVCAQRGLAASPKRVRATRIDLQYPIEPTYKRGRYEVNLVVERQVFESDRWEPVAVPNRPRPYLVASVGRATDAAVRMPLSSGLRSFDVSRQANAADFDYYLRTGLHSADRAVVTFDIIAEWNGSEYPVDTRSFEVHRRTHEDQERDLRYFAQQAAEQLINRLDPGRATRQGRVTIERWDYNRLADRYEAEIEVRWGGGGFFGRSHVIHGTLESNGVGSNARFQAERASREARDRWRRLAGVEEGLRLDPLKTNLERQAMENTDGAAPPADTLLPAVASSF